MYVNTHTYTHIYMYCLKTQWQTFIHSSMIFNRLYSVVIKVWLPFIDPYSFIIFFNHLSYYKIKWTCIQCNISVFMMGKRKRKENTMISSIIINKLTLMIHLKVTFYLNSLLFFFLFLSCFLFFSFFFKIILVCRNVFQYVNCI